MTDKKPTRRRMLKLLGSASVIGLAGCSDEPTDTPEGDAPEGTPTEEEAPAEETPTETPEGGGAEETPTEEGGGETYSLTVTVEDDAGEPVEGATVSIESDEGIVGAFGGGEEEESETDENGQVTAENLEDGEYTVTASHDTEGEAEDTVEIQGSDEELTLTLGEGGDGTPTESDDSGS